MTAMRLSANDVNVAEDLIQEMWIRAIQRIETFRWNSSLLTWLTGILVNLNRERFREKVHEKLSEEFSATLTHKDSGVEVIDLENAIASLPVGYREILILHDVEGYKHREIAEMLNIDEGTSKSQLFNARRAMRKYLNS
jgi:RNA polymerase sigma-70 factor (ECF subfamily)